MRTFEVLGSKTNSLPPACSRFAYFRFRSEAVSDAASFRASDPVGALGDVVAQPAKSSNAASTNEIAPTFLKRIQAPVRIGHGDRNIASCSVINCRTSSTHHSNTSLVVHLQRWLA